MTIARGLAQAFTTAGSNHNLGCVRVTIVVIMFNTGGVMVLDRVAEHDGRRLRKL